MNSHTKHVVFADVGFGDVKPAWLDDQGKIQADVFPSMVAQPRFDIMNLMRTNRLFSDCREVLRRLYAREHVRNPE